MTIDGGLLIFVFFLSYSVIDFLGEAPGYVRGGILIFMFFLYEPLMITFFGFTIGHYVMKLRVKNNGDPTKNIILPLAFLRSAVKGLFGSLSFFTMGFNHKNRALHYLASNAVVIEVE